MFLNNTYERKLCFCSYVLFLKFRILKFKEYYQKVTQIKELYYMVK